MKRHIFSFFLVILVLFNIACDRQLKSKIYQEKEASEKIHLALNYWLENNFWYPNWWYRVIGVPMVLDPIISLKRI